MKKYMLLLITLTMVIVGSFSSYAACWWDTDNNGIKACWDQLSSKGTLYLYKGSSYKVGGKITTGQSRTEHDYSQLIKDTGPGTYHFTITDSVGRTWTSEDLQVTENMVEATGKYTWYNDHGTWTLRDFKGNVMTGWQQVDGKWYYLDTKTGKCFMNTVTPDGYRVDETGAWDGNPPVSKSS